MNKIEKINTLANSKFLSLYEAEYVNKKGNNKKWIIASRKNKETLDKTFFQNESLKDDAVVIVPFHKEEKKIVIIRQFRVPINSYIYELPAGLIDENEEFLVSIKRELKEETGLELKEILDSKIKSNLFLSPGMTDESVTLAVCTCTGTLSNEFMEDDEDIEALMLSQEEATKLLDNNDNFDIKCYIVLKIFSILGEKIFQ